MFNIGDSVKVIRLREQVPQAVISTLGKIGIVVDYKMTDGSGIGYLVKFDSVQSWFFEIELKAV